MPEDKEPHRFYIRPEVAEDIKNGKREYIHTDRSMKDSTSRPRSTGDKVVLWSRKFRAKGRIDIQYIYASDSTRWGDCHISIREWEEVED